MKQVNTREFLNNLSLHLNELAKTNEPLLVTAPNRQVVIVSKAQYDMINKTNGDEQ